MCCTDCPRSRLAARLNEPRVGFRTVDALAGKVCIEYEDEKIIMADCLVESLRR